MPGKSHGQSSLVGYGLWGRKESDTTEATAAAASHASKVTLKILQARLQQYINFPIFNLDLEKAEEPEIKLPTSVGSSKKQESSRKTPTFALLTLPNPLTMWIPTNCGKF